MTIEGVIVFIFGHWCYMNYEPSMTNICLDFRGWTEKKLLKIVMSKMLFSIFTGVCIARYVGKLCIFCDKIQTRSRSRIARGEF